jgi:hypothetical protein
MTATIAEPPLHLAAAGKGFKIIQITQAPVQMRMSLTGMTRNSTRVRKPRHVWFLLGDMRNVIRKISSPWLETVAAGDFIIVIQVRYNERVCSIFVDLAECMQRIVYNIRAVLPNFGHMVY